MLCKVNEARHNGSYVRGFYLQDMSRKSKLTQTKSRIVDVRRLMVRTGSNCKWAQNYFGSGKNVLKLDRGNSCATATLLKGVELYTQNKSML